MSAYAGAELLRVLQRFTVKHGRGASETEVADTLGISRQAANVRLARARELGYVSRSFGTSTGERAVWWYNVTEKGRGML